MGEGKGACLCKDESVATHRQRDTWTNSQDKPHPDHNRQAALQLHGQQAARWSTKKCSAGTKSRISKNPVPQNSDRSPEARAAAGGRGGCGVRGCWKDLDLGVREKKLPPIPWSEVRMEDTVDKVAISAALIAAAAFSSSKPGYISKTREKGLGYYQDGSSACRNGRR